MSQTRWLMAVWYGIGLGLVIGIPLAVLAGRFG